MICFCMNIFVVECVLVYVILAYYMVQVGIDLHYCYLCEIECKDFNESQKHLRSMKHVEMELEYQDKCKICNYQFKTVDSNDQIADRLKHEHLIGYKHLKFVRDYIKDEIYFCK